MARKIRLSVSQSGFQPPVQLLETNFCPICWDCSQFQAHPPPPRGLRTGVVLYSQLNGALVILLLAKALCPGPAPHLLVVNSLIPLSTSTCFVELFCLPSLPCARGMVCMLCYLLTNYTHACSTLLRHQELHHTSTSCDHIPYFGAWESRNPSLPLGSAIYLIMSPLRNYLASLR